MVRLKRGVVLQLVVDDRRIVIAGRFPKNVGERSTERIRHGSVALNFGDARPIRSIVDEQRRRGFVEIDLGTGATRVTSAVVELHVDNFQRVRIERIFDEST